MQRPTEVPAMAASASGVSNTRSVPNSACRPSVIRNTPPSRPTSSPNTRTRSSRRSESAMAWFRALAMVTSGIGPPLPAEPKRLVPLAPEVLGELALEDPLEQLLDGARLGGDHARPHRC